MNPLPTSRLDAAIDDYLSHFRALGRGYEQEEWLLGLLRRFLVQQGLDDLDRDGFDRWRRTFSHRHPNTRNTYERIVYCFCRYRRRAEPDRFVPDPASLARPIPHALPTPIEPKQIARTLQRASTLQSTPASPLRPAAMRLALVLLYTAGLRVGELLRLRLEDVDPETGVLRIQEAKFHKSRWVPLSPSAQTELRGYLKVRCRRGFDNRDGAPLLCNRWRSHSWHAYSVSGMQQALHELFLVAGMVDHRGRCPRVHDMRHAFAQEALRRWYAEGVDVQVSLPKLALYMGHVSIASTAYYLRWMPAVVEHANERFERRCGSLVSAGGRS
jgi:integrase